MAIAQRKPVHIDATQPGALRDERTRAKSLRPFERAGVAVLRAQTLESLAAFERAAVAYPALDLRLRVAASRAMDDLLIEQKRGSLPAELASEIERWDEGEFAGTRADVELANFAIAALLGSDVRVGEPAEDGDE